MATGSSGQTRIKFDDTLVPLSLNRYIYAEDDPMTLVDPTGRFAIDGDLFVKGKPSDDPVLYLVAAPQVTPSVMVVPPPTPTASLSYPSVTPPNVPTDTSTNSVTTPPTSAFQPYQGTSTPPTQDFESCVTTSSCPSDYNTSPSGSSNQAGSVAVAAGGTAAAIGAGAEAGAIYSSDAIVGATAATFGWIGAAAVLGFAAGYTIGYLSENWNTATPESTLGAFFQGLSAPAGILRDIRGAYNGPLPGYNGPPPWIL